jgi:hypothetical protein
LKKTWCALVLSGKSLDEKAIQAVNKASEASPAFSWVILDSTKVKLRKPSEKDIGLPKYVPGMHRLLLLGNATDGSSMLEASPFLGRFDEDGVLPFVITNSPSVRGKKIDRNGLALMKRKPPTQAYRAPALSPTVNPEATILPTAQQEDNRKAAVARRAQREAARRAEMDAEAEDFIEYEGEDAGMEVADEDDEDEDDEEAEDEEEEVLLD